MGNIMLQQSFHLEVCCTCGIAFAVPDGFRAERLSDKRPFWCPNGHSQHYTQSEEDRLRQELAGKQLLLEQAHQRELYLNESLKKTEAAKRRLAKRLENGVCPVPGCKRHFTNLQRHLATEHKGAAIPELAAMPEQKLLN